MFKYIRDVIYRWQRGLKRVASLEARGRVYERADSPGAVQARVKAIGTVRPTRVYRAAEDAWYKVNQVTGELTKEE